ncbi:MAG: hypothetical protein RTU92_04590 [Candidatus Thorarchaeota archaeon]
MGLTDKQRDYIDYMLTNDYTDQKDKQTLARHLKKTGKKSYTDFSVPEASALIDDLLNKDVQYKLICGETVPVERWEAHGSDSMGEVKMCLHHCPKEIDMGSCEDYQRYEDEMHSDLEED